MSGAVLEIDLAAIGANWCTLRALHSAGPVAGVVKADAYGLGAAQVAPVLHAAGCRHFFVAHLAEAEAIRGLLPQHGPDATLLAVLSGLIPGTEALYAESGIVPVLGSLAEIDHWAAHARRLGRILPALLHVDTGMHRLGLDARELALLAQDPARLDGIGLRYVMTHLVSAELSDDPLNETQRRRFAQACAVLPATPRSLANSSGIFLGDAFASDLARPGAALYGINPTPDRPNPMRPAVRLRARVLQVREIPAGESVGYNAIWRAGRPSRIATACVGYADGWLRSQSGRGHALFDGAPVPLVGRVSMDLTTYDVTDHPAIGPGAWLELIGPDLPADAVAQAAGTNGYEILTSLGRRYARVYTA
ncbi:alanine racemase [Limobrevibacterium gyesilva]|uniref:alanine racemase n=1 Tax=Limobrevibacterium gyesilva TaxID=2991712 RepID=UPI002226D040